ncbi:MAG: hypothetical protein RIQ33_2492 [Bacteroidota bacterium]|jgi:hypothetical protein
MKKIVSVITLVTYFSLSIYVSKAAVRKYSNEFLSIGVGARGLAMGGAQVASSGDATSIYWNPSGMCSMDNKFQIAAMHSEYFGGIAKYDFGAIAIPLQKDAYAAKSFLGVGLIRFAVDDIPNTLQLIDANGSVNYNKVTSFSAADYGFFTSYAREIKSSNYRDNEDYTRVGGSAKIVRRVVGTFAKSWGFGIDASFQMRKGNWLMGAVLQDATSTFNAWSFHFSNADQAVLAATGNIIPTNSMELTLPKLRLGGAYKFSTDEEKFSIAPELGLDITTDGKRNVLVRTGIVSFDPKLGLEAGYKKVVFLRGGISNIQHQTDDNGKKITTLQPNVGIGLKLGGFSIDYALTSPGSTGNVLYSHIFSLKLDLSKTKNYN